ncbi:protein kinase C and casein kinase substrate in neurons 2 protein-like [Dendronephthya gigantea]|uniref:protein kinase C and casein kinase substrate in neurons 2 protein-like n=1 Tax=Dendronephthya gigantea TaxID=151771 RepID=UPI00106D8AF4|nr:protein kinase C and casein kinase substrate in neurons 2 protein-like [Dendronephthya gigantea]
MVHERADIEMKYTLKLRDWSKRWNEINAGYQMEESALPQICFEVEGGQRVTPARYHNVVDMSESERLTNIYKGLLLKVDGSDATKDLKWWSSQYGPGMPKKWPEFEDPDVWDISSNQHKSKPSMIRRLSLRRRNSKQRYRTSVTVTTPAQPENTRASDSDSYNPFMSASTEPGNDEDNNVTYDHPRSSYYMTPSNGMQEGFPHDEHYRSPNIVDSYNDAWNRNTTFSPTNREQTAHSAYQQPSGNDYYNQTSWEYDPSGTSTAKSHPTTDVAVDHDNDSVDGGAQLQRETTGASLNPFDNDDDEDFVEDENTEVEAPKVNGDILDNGIPENADDVTGVPVRAKYNYDASEDDELSFQVGDIITQLSGEDGQGWCKGRLNGVEGLFPAKWVEAV